MKKVFLLLLLVFCSASLFAQADQPAPESPSVPPDAVSPVVIFSQTWPEAIPPFYSVVVDGSGRTTYHSTPSKPDSGNPYDLQFVISEQTRGKIFDLAKQLNYFQGNFDYRKSRIAFTGKKTLKFQNGKAEHETSYNWSDNLALQDLTKIFQNMSETIELGRALADKYRFDKLGVDAEMRKLEEATKDERTVELQAIQPILSRIAKDPGMMNITRHRAELLLAKIPKSAKVDVQQ